MPNTSTIISVMHMVASVRSKSCGAGWKYNHISVFGTWNGFAAVRSVRVLFGDVSV